MTNPLGGDTLIFMGRWRKVFLILLLIIALPVRLYAKSVVREGEAIVDFRKLHIPEKVEPGQVYQFSAQISIKKNIWEDEVVFFLIIAPDGRILINNSFSPSLPATRWTVGEIVKLGPANGYIPLDFPPGTYNIKMGLYSTKLSPTEEPLYVREPYTNAEIKDFIVGQITVEPAKQSLEAEKKRELVISNFETLEDVRKWELRSATLEQDADNAADAKYAGKVTYLKNNGCCPGALLDSFFSYSEPKYAEWQNYDELQLYIYGPKDSEGRTYLKYPVQLLIKDRSGRRFTFSVPNNQEKSKPLVILLSEVGKAVDLMDIGTLNFYVGQTPEDQDWVIYLDNIKLASLGLDKPKGPFVKFEGLKITKDKIKPGEEIEIAPSFSISSRFIDDYDLYIHIYRAYDHAGYKDINISPSPPTTAWEVNKTISQGPFKIYIPPNAPPGKYDIEIGLFLSRQTTSESGYVKYHRGKDGTYYIEQPRFPDDYFKQPYVNYEQYGDWVVGSFELTSP